MILDDKLSSMHLISVSSSIFGMLLYKALNFFSHGLYELLTLISYGILNSLTLDPYPHIFKPPFQQILSINQNRDDCLFYLWDVSNCWLLHLSPVFQFLGTVLNITCRTFHHRTFLIMIKCFSLFD